MLVGARGGEEELDVGRDVVGREVEDGAGELDDVALELGPDPDGRSRVDADPDGLGLDDEGGADEGGDVGALVPGVEVVAEGAGAVPVGSGVAVGSGSGDDVIGVGASERVRVCALASTSPGGGSSATGSPSRAARM